MKTVEFEAVLPLSCSETFNLASDLQGYSDFLPMLKKIDVLEKNAQSTKALFKFDLDGALGAIARTISPVKMDQLARITTKGTTEVTGESIEGPLKSIFMQCTLKPEGANQTRAKVKIQFESGKIWPVDNLIKAYIEKEGLALIADLDTYLVTGLKKRHERMALNTDPA